MDLSISFYDKPLGDCKMYRNPLNNSPFLIIMYLIGGLAPGQSYHLSFSTFFGGSAGEVIRDIEVDHIGNIYVAGTTRSANFPISENACQSKKGAKDDAIVTVLSPNLDRIIYSTFLGGNGNDAGRASCVGNDASLSVAGSSSGKDWPTQNALQDVRKGPRDAIIARLSF